MNTFKLQRFAIYRNGKLIGHEIAPTAWLACIASHMRDPHATLADITNPHIIKQYNAIADSKETEYKFDWGFSLMIDPDIILFN